MVHRTVCAWIVLARANVDCGVVDGRGLRQKQWLWQGHSAQASPPTLPRARRSLFCLGYRSGVCCCHVAALFASAGRTAKCHWRLATVAIQRSHCSGHSPLRMHRVYGVWTHSRTLQFAHWHIFIADKRYAKGHASAAVIHLVNPNLLFSLVRLLSKPQLLGIAQTWNMRYLCNAIRNKTNKDRIR